MSELQQSSIELQDRDHALLRGLFESRVMTAKHIATLYFDGKPESAKKRLQKLKAAGLIGERKRQVNAPAALLLTRAGFRLLQRDDALDGLPALDPTSFDRRAQISDLTLRHELEIMNVKTAFHAALASSEIFSITEFITWPLLYQFHASRPGRGRTDSPVKPDGYIRIHEKEEGTTGFDYDFFLEVDRSNEVQDRLVSQARCYLDYYNSGGFAVRRGGARDEFKDYPFRVLMVFKTAERRNNTAERLLQNNPPILTQVCLSTLAEVTADPFGEVWMRPKEYREATEGTQFDAERQRGFHVYRRQSERELFVEAKVRKTQILEN